MEQAELKQLGGHLLAAGPAHDAHPQSERADAKRLRLALACLKRGRVSRAQYHLLQLAYFTRSAVTRTLAQRARVLAGQGRTAEARRMLEEAYVGTAA